MIRQFEIQDQNGNKIYRHTSSDIVWDLDTGHTVKEDIDTLMNALGISNSSSSSSNKTELAIDASTLSGYTIDQLVLNDTYVNAINQLNNEISNKAPLASPSFSGTPTTPNVKQGDDSTKIANTSYVDTAVAALKTYVNSSVDDSGTDKAPINSPQFTGTPTTPNVSQGDNSKKIANTAYVDLAASNVKTSIIDTLTGYAVKNHSHAASDISSGTFSSTAIYAQNGTDYSTARIRNISFSTSVPTSLANGTLLAVYEE
jgi:hypothetical protein